MIAVKVSCWAIEAGPGRRPGWEVATASPVVAGELEVAHFFGPRARQRAEAYAATLTTPTQPRAAVPPLLPPRIALPPAPPPPDPS